MIKKIFNNIINHKKNIELFEEYDNKEFFNKE